MEPLNRLEKSAEALNAESDRFRINLDALEQQLKELSVGIEVEHNGWGYGKMERQWGFYWVAGAAGRKSVFELPRTERTGLAQVMGVLIDRLCVAADTEKQKLAEANRILEYQRLRASGRNA